MRLRKLLKLGFIFVFTALFIISCSGGGGGTGSTGNTSNTNNPNNPTNPGNLSGDTFLALYIVGSDLESDSDAGTADLLELINGYNQLSVAEKGNVYVYVAFGGANKEGWKGVKYATMNCIIQDGKDKKFGNDSCYDYVQEITTTNAKNMSHPQAFQHFIDRVKSLSANFNTKILVLWNHGAAYDGYGVDENWQKDGTTLDPKKGDLSNNDTLTIYEIRDVLKKANVKFDIIGFDACLMANLEVASAIKDFATYLLASEEVEPGHGWHYTDVIHILAKNTNKSVLDRAKLLVDSFVTNKEHDIGSGLTLSVIDLTKIDTLLTALDGINFNTLDLNKIAQAEITSQKYGYFMDSDTLEEFFFTMDLYQFLDKAGLTAVRDKIKDIVLYKKDDGSIVSHGISFAPFSKVINFIANGNTDLKTKNILPQNYFANLEALKTKIENDITEPQVSKQTCTNGGTTGLCINVTENETALSSVGVLVLIPSTDPYGNQIFYLSSYDYLPKIGNNQYFFDKAEYSNVLLFCNGQCTNQSQAVYAPLYFLYQTPKNELVYISPAIAEKKAKGYIILKYDPVNSKLRIYFAITPTSKRQYVIGKDVKTLQFVYYIINAQSQIDKQVSQPMDFSNGIDITQVSLTGTGITPLMLIEAMDVAENSAFFRVP